ncbi:MAG: hypothetical protein ACUVSX_12555 [Aggregatilineales bacterium]
MDFKSIAMLTAAVVVALIVLGFVSTVLNAIVPLAMVAVVAFILGRVSTQVNLLEVAGRLLRRASAAAAKPAASRAEKPATGQQPAARSSGTARRAEATQHRLSEPQAQPSAAAKDDFTLRSEAQILAEMKRREAELAEQKAAPSADEVAAALEERRRRLLGDQADQS